MRSLDGPVLLEREGELATLGRAVRAAAAGEGGLVVVEGAAGIGKTRLVKWAAARAGELGMRVLVGRAGELEQDLAFALVRQLFEPVLRGADDSAQAQLLSGAAALAAPLLLGQGGSADGGDVQSVPHGLYWLVANLAQRQPVFLGVDDLHWADPASARALAYLVARLEGLGVLVVAATRPVASGTASRSMDWLLRQPTTAVIRPNALTAAAVAMLVRARLAHDAEAGFCDACHQATGGNAFLVGALLEELIAEGTAASAADRERVRRMAPATVASAVLARLSRLPEGATALARAVAVLGDAAAYRHVVRLAGMEPAGAQELVGALARAELLDDVRPLRFVHPIVRNAVYGDLSRIARARLHRQAAALLGEEAAPLQQIAVHLIHADAEADPAVVATLRAAAAEAMAEGAPEASVTYLRRAYAEPPPVADRAAVLAELGMAEAMSRDPLAVEHLAEALRLSPEPLQRARTARQLAAVLTMGGCVADAVAVLDAAIAALEAAEADLALSLENDLIFAARLHPSTRELATARTRRLGPRLAPPDAPMSPAQRLALVNVAVEATMALQPADEVAALASRALGNGELLAEAPAHGPGFILAVMVLMFSDRLGQASQMLDLAMEDARRRGSAGGFAQVSCIRSNLAYRAGDVTGAEAHAAASFAALDAPMPLIAPMQVSFLVDSLLERGDLAGADEALARYDMAGPLGDGYHFNHLLESRGRLRLLRGNAAGALEDLLEAGRRQQDWGMPNPAILAWRSSAALAHAALGHRDEAGVLTEEEVGLAERFGADRSLGMALRAHGLVVGGEEGVEMLRRAADVLEDSCARLEHARALTDLGAALRRRGQRVEAREPLRQGLDLALRCGATMLADRARHELSAAGAKPRRLVLTGVEALSPSERRTAEMAASGMSNPQIAQALFVSPRTVEMHLGHAYRKLGIASRANLAAALGQTSEVVGS